MSKRERNRMVQQARILDAAHGLFSAHGFDDVSMSDVAAEAGVARATVFNHFGSKRSLVEAITGEVMADYEAMLENALDHEELSVPDLVRALFEQMGAGIEGDPRFYRGVFREIAELQQGLEERAAPEALAKLLRRGQDRDELSTDHRTDDLVRAFSALSNGTITSWLYGDADEPLHVRMRRAAEIFLGPVAVKATPPSGPLPILYEGRPT